MEFLYITAVDGTQIPILKQVVGFGAQITVDGDGGCRLNSQDAYLVSIVNGRRPKTKMETAEGAAEFVKDKSIDQVFDKVKEVAEQEVLPAVLRAMNLKKMAGYVFHGAKILASIPAQVAQAVLFDTTEIGDDTWHVYRQPLPDGNSALIRWFGEPN